MRHCPYCNSTVLSLDHICPQRVRELLANGISPGKARVLSADSYQDRTKELDRIKRESKKIRYR